MDNTDSFGTIAGSQPMRNLTLPLRLFVCAALLLFATSSFAALVGPAGYTNGFTTNQLTADWASFSRAGGGNDTYDLDIEANTNISLLVLTNQIATDAAAIPAASATSVWSSAGQFIATRPTGNRYTALVGKFVNNTGTNATQVALSYSLAFAFSGGGTVATEDAGKGSHVYYSLSGTLSNWSTLATLNSTANAGTFSMATNITLNWTNGGTLYVLWIDDNANQGTDAAYEIDNFSLLVLAGVPPTYQVNVTSPSNNAVILSGTEVIARATAINGTPPYSVAYFTNSGAGNTVFAGTDTSATPPYSVSLGVLPVGTYNIAAAVVDSSTTPMLTNSFTNTFYIADPISLTLTAPANNANFPNNVSVTASATVAGGRTPYSVQFYLDNVANGAPVTSSPYERNFGTLFVGDHTVKAVVTDASGWVSNSLVSTIHITGPLGVSLTPTNGATFIFGQPVVLDSVPGGGVAPYAVRFYTNGAPLNWISTAPFSTNLGVIASGTYTTFVYAVDSTIAAEQRAYSTTNVFTVTPNPILATLTNPTNNQPGVAGQPFTLAATASVTAPLTIGSVEFFVDGVSVRVDTNAPFTASYTSATAVSRSVYAAATDSLGRKSFTATNTVTFIIDPLANDNFANRIPLGTPASVTGQNVGATSETGETISQGFTRWGATMWYSWVAPVTGSATIDTFGSDFNTLLSIYTGNAVNALTLVGRNDNAPNQAAVSLITFNATAGTEYQIQLGGAQGFQGGAQPATGNFQLNVTMPPAVAITAPTNNSVFRSGTNVTVTAIATPAAGTIVKVDFYRGATVLATVSNAPYSFVFSNAAPGTNTLYAVATDSLGQVGTSSNVNLVFFDQGVTLVSPADGATFLTTNNITINAVALLESGVMTNIQFFVDNVKVGQDTNAPFSISWTNVMPGSHRITAVGQSDAGVIYNSRASYIAVAQTLVASNSVWKFKDDGSNQGTTWIATDFDDSGWGSGLAPLGYGDSGGRLVLTTNSYGVDSNNKFTTTYYRQAFVAPNSSYTNVILNIQRDDGAVVYLNGVELTRFNMPTGAITSATLAAGNASDDGGTTFVFNVNPALVHPGTNFFAVSIHQDTNNSSDIWFVMDLRGVPEIIRNQSPTISFANLTNGTSVIAPVSMFLSVNASDPDGFVTKVELFDGTTKVTESVLFPFELNWTDVPVGIHSLTLVATDNGGQTGASEPVRLVVFNSDRQPIVQITSPLNGAAIEGPTNLAISAVAYSVSSITSVEFITNGASLAFDSTPPYSVTWPSSFGTNTITAVVSDDNAGRGTSAPISVVITIPPTNYDAPFIVGQTPLAGATVSNLTSITVRFSERVIGVDAADMEINGLSATGLVVNSSSNYTFQFPQPAYGTVDIRWEETHHITDVGYPDNLPFNDDGLGAQWTYKLIDVQAPTIVSRTPAANSLVTNLTQITVTFSEVVTGVDAADLLVNNTPAFAVSGGGASYVFDVVQPNSGAVNVTWATTHGIIDTATNGFNRTAGAWSFTLDSRSILVQSNANWLFVKGTNEASSPISLWRTNGFDDSAWSNAPAPFYYGDAYNTPGNPGTLLTDMQSNYTTIYLREKFVVANASAITNLILGVQIDDGFVAWINGVEVARFNVLAGELAFDAVATNSFIEPGGNGPFGYTNYTLPNPATYLVSGTNVLAVQAINQNLTNSSDFGFNAQLYTFLSVEGLVPPRISTITPGAGVLFYLTNITVTFTEPVTNVDASDLLVNGVPAAGVSSPTNTTFVFNFSQPAYGSVDITWVNNHGIVDFDATPHAFNATASAARPHYNLVNPSTPVVQTQTPTANTTINYLTNILIHFSEFVQGVNASDLLLNGVPATGVTGGGADYTFTFDQPAYGTVNITWAANHNIKDFDAPPVDFQPIVPGNTWSYNFVDPIPPLFLRRGPYLQSGGWTNITIRWRSDVASDSIVYFGTNASALTNTVYVNDTNVDHIVMLNGLTPSTRYYYKVGSSYRIIGNGSDYYFDTAPLPGTVRPVRAWVLGDPGTGTQNQRNVRDAYYQFANTNGAADLWIMLGDNAYNSGLDTEYQTAVFDMYPTVLRNKVLWPTIGNHESNQSYDNALDFAYLHIFSTPLLGEAGGTPSGNIKYYSFDYANVHFVCLDSMTSTRSSTSAMANWLKADLSSTTQTWVIAYWHHPPYTRGNHNSDSEADLMEVRQNILPIIEYYGVDLVLNGHSHAIERSYLLNGHYGLSSTLTSAHKIDAGDGRVDGTGAYHKNAIGQGVVYLVTGSAGQITGGQLNHPAHYTSQNELGSTIIDVLSNRMDVVTIGTNGAARDHFTLVKAPILPMKIGSVVRVPQSQDVTLTFDAYSNVTYTVEGKGAMNDAWQAIQTLTAATTNRSIQITQPGTNSAQFYRLRSP